MISETDELFARLGKLINDANEKQTATLKLEIQTEIAGVKLEIAELKNIVAREKDKVSKLEKTQTDIQTKYNILEKSLKRNNILIFGLKCENKPNSLAEYIIQKINLWLELDLTINNLNNVFPVGKPNDNRPILVQFQSYLTKVRVLRECRKLKGTGISISEDLTKEDREKQKTLIKHKKLAQSKGYKAYIKNKKLYINNEEYTAHDLEEKENEEQPVTPQKQQNPEQRKVSSAPATPLLQDTEGEEDSEEESDRENTNYMHIYGYTRNKKHATNCDGTEELAEKNSEEDSTSKKRKIITSSTEGNKKKKGPIIQKIIPDTKKINTRSVNK